MLDPSFKLMDAVHSCVVERILATEETLNISGESLFPGKMLRTRLAVRLVEAGACLCEQEIIVSACSAVELVHTASLCHDDIIDEAGVRRRSPTLWKAQSRPVAILAGDMLICEAMELMTSPFQRVNLIPFVAKVKEVVVAEIHQELQCAGKLLDKDEFIRIARGKTGSLFAFVAEVCGGTDVEMRRLFAEAGYVIGTAYQLLDDILDIEGREEQAGKTLGTDIARGKQTMPQVDTSDYKKTRQTLCELLDSVSDLFPRDTPASSGFAKFISSDILPLFKGLSTNLEVIRI